MKDKLTITLSNLTQSWLKNESDRAGQTPEEFVATLLAELADPVNVERDLLDQLLADAVKWFPSLMTLEEQTEMREEVLDFLCHRIQEQHVSQLGTSMSHAEARQLRDRLAERAAHCWQRH